MQAHGVTLSFNREMADSSRELVGSDISAAVGLESYPRLIDDVLDQPENKEVRELYVNPEALKGLRPGQPLPSGTVLSAPTFKALLDDKGEFVRDANGRLIRGRLDRVVVMEKRTGWGAEYPEALRNGEWEYGRFSADGTLTATANYKACFECHQPKSDQDFVFSLPRLLKFSSRVIEGRGN